MKDNCKKCNANLNKINSVNRKYTSLTEDCNDINIDGFYDIEGVFVSEIPILCSNYDCLDDSDVCIECGFVI